MGTRKIVVFIRLALFALPLLATNRDSAATRNVLRFCRLLRTGGMAP